MSATVLVIMDGEYGDGLSPAPDSAVWLLDSATNLDAWERLRRVHPDFAVTTFRDGVGPLPDRFAAMLPTIDLHHGEYSQPEPYRRLEVHGIRPSQVVRHALAEIGFSVETLTADGFTAIRDEARGPTMPPEGAHGPG